MGNILKAISILLLCMTLPVAAATGPEQMRRFLDSVTTLQAQFEQSVLNEQKSAASRAQGTFYLKRPNQFRWDYSEPESQQIVADGRQIWLYDPDLEQVSVTFQRKALNGTPAMLLISGEPVEKAFEVIDIGNSQGLDWVELIPRDEESQFIRILLAFTNDELRRMEMADKFGQTTRFQFYNIEHNPAFASTFFQFERPDNVDLYNQ